MAAAAAAFIAPLTRGRRAGSKPRSVAWAAASLPGLAALGALLPLYLASMRPKPRRRSHGCYGEGHPCWVHEQYPYAWLVGLVAFAAVGLALLFTIGLRAHRRRKSPDPAPT
nr:hypothetical protein [Streptomyces antibioticus]